MSTRQQQRQLQRALMKRGQAVLGAGLPETPQKDDIVAFAFVLQRMLADAARPHRASEAARVMLALNEVSTRRRPGTMKLACAKGCGYCCHTWVGATVPEVLHLAAAVRVDAARRPGLIERIVELGKPLAGLTPAQRFGAKLACPLLVDNACSRYAERPAVCRQATSFDLSGCIDEFEGRGQGGEIKVSAVYLAHARNSRVPLTAALQATGLDARTYELSAALGRVLQTAGCEERWLAGEDVMAGVSCGPQEPAAVMQAVNAIVREITAASGA